MSPPLPSDAHCHLHALPAPLQPPYPPRAVVNGTHPGDWQLVADLAAAHPWIIPSYGLHPWWAGPVSDASGARLLAHWQGGALVGEIGLDRARADRGGASMPTQIATFSWQWAHAARFRRSVTVHCVQAWGPLRDLVESMETPPAFLLHGYAGPAEMIPWWVKKGAYFSVNGAHLHPRAQRRWEALRLVPLHRLLLETDAPYQPPPGQATSHPDQLPTTLLAVAALFQLPAPELGGMIEANLSQFSAGLGSGEKPGGKK
jgi:TatD DNase family protein